MARHVVPEGDIHRLQVEWSLPSACNPKVVARLAGVGRHQADVVVVDQLGIFAGQAEAAEGSVATTW